jgi:hypothetical protein
MERMCTVVGVEKGSRSSLSHGSSNFSKNREERNVCHDERTLQKKMFFATCNSPRVRSLYMWRTVSHVNTRGESG